MADLPLRVLSDAHAVALSARLGYVQDARIAALGVAAGRLEDDHPVRRMVEAFRARQSAARHDPAALADAGATLQRDVLRVLRPGPSDLARVDIHG